MNTYIGIDLGTSSVKILLVDKNGKILNSISREYPVYYPQTGYSEQNPIDWYNESIKGIDQLLKDFDRTKVKGISFGGQMHGLVALDKNNEVIRNAILWNDGRTEKETEYLNNVIGKKVLSNNVANIAFAGFTAPKIMWLKNNEPQSYARIKKILLPKDYLAFRLSGEFSTDYSDASGTLLLDIKNRKWSQKMCDVCGVDINWLPKLYESYQVVGVLKKDIAMELGLSQDVKIIAGAGDNAAAAIGTGTVDRGLCNISLGTSGTIFITSDIFSADKNNALHSFCHASGKYHLMGCILSAASCSQWWVNDILKSDHLTEQKIDIDFLGNNDIFFLPYLMGERSPHNDVNAKGAFVGLKRDTTRFDMTLAVLEGVAFALRDCYEVAKANGVNISSTRICGGGAKSELWKQIISNVLGLDVHTLVTEEGPSYGAALLAMVGCNEYSSILDATNRCIQIKQITKFNNILVQKYDDKYNKFKKIYPKLREVFM